jgi:exonuclease SbcD
MESSGPARPPRRQPAIYHVADVRLGGAFPFLGEAGEAHRQQVRATFVSVVDRALELQPSVVLVTGNLFGTPHPTRDLAEFARAQIGRLTQAGIPVSIAAGPLDAPLDAHYAADAVAEMEHVVVFPPSPGSVVLPEHDLTIVGVSWASASTAPDFLSDLAARRRTRFLAGALYVRWPDSDEGVRSLRRQIAASGADYLALGGSPVRRDLSADSVAAWCPGAPELVAPEEGAGGPLLVELADTIRVLPETVARRRFCRFTLQPAAYPTVEALAAAIRGLGDPHLAAVVRLVGHSRLDQFIDVGALQDRLAGEFLALDVVDESQPNLDAMDTAAFPELSVAARFVDAVRAEMTRATSEGARRRVGAALRLGLSLLEGRRPQ